MKTISLFAILFSFSSVANAAVVTKIDHKQNGYIQVHVAPEMAKLDVLFVIDNSGSMATQQASLASNLPTMLHALQSLGHVDMHLGVTTTDMDGSSTPTKGSFVGKFLTNADPTFTAQLQAQMVAAGTNGSSTEQHFAGAMAALSDPMLSSDHAGFLRTDANLAILTLTDEDDQSLNVATPDVFAAFLKGLKTNASMLNFTSIMAPMGETRCGNNSTTNRLETAVGMLNGKVINICDADYGTHLDNLGNGLAAAALHEVPLFTEAMATTITVTYGTMTLLAGDLHAGYIFDSQRNVVILGDMINWNSQPMGTEVIVNFQPKNWH